jgi:hypothetical protein
MAYTTLVAGTTITASWANASVRDQVVSPFTDAAARTTAISSPVDGMISVLTTTDRVDVYNGSSWSALVAPSNGALTAYTPTLTQSATVSKTVDAATYQRVGRTIIGQAAMTCSSSGTAANQVLIGLPVAATNSFAVVGVGAIFDASVSFYYTGIAQLTSTTTARLLVTSGAAGSGLGAATFTAALVSTDGVYINFHYEAAADA